MKILFQVEGKMSVFGGPSDKGMSRTEGLGLFSSEQDMINHGLADYLLPEQEAGVPGLGRRLNPNKYYLACRWWETDLKREYLKNAWAWVESASTRKRLQARPVDSGPAEWTNRVADLSPGLAKALNLKTDGICRVTITDEATEFNADTDHHRALTQSPMANGPRIYTTEEWGAAPAKVSYFPKHPAEGIVIHNTEGANRQPLSDPEQEKASAFENARSIQRDHFARGFSDTGQHFTISQGGIITEGRHGTLAAAKSGLVVRGAHCPHANDQWWGIEIAGDNRNNYVVTEQQWSALIDLAGWLAKLAGKALEIEPHNHFKSTSCPGKIAGHIAGLKAAIAKRNS
jgi:N-acetylmuramoyl-L-alanine amidase